MSFKHDLIIGQRYTTYKIQDVFKHNRYKGMRYSASTNTLVLISDHYSSPYEDEWKEGILHYTGSGLIGDQQLTRENKNLVDSNKKGIEIYLFEIFDNTSEKYIYRGRVKLTGEPYQQKQFDSTDNLRDVWVFPLKPIDVDHSSFILPEELITNAIRSPKKKRNLKNLDEEKLKQRAKIVTGTTSSRTVKTTMYIRNQYVSDYVKARAKGICDLCECPAPFISNEGVPYLESHHIVWLSKGGKDTLENTVALCPNCHRKMHVLDNQEDRTKLLNKAMNYQKEII